MLKIGVLISGRGTNLQSLIDATADANFPARIACVISNKADAPGLKRALDAGLPALTVSHKAFDTKQSFEEKLDAELRAHGVQLICLAGFMRLLTPWFVDQWRDRLINIHPSLLPAFPGLDTHRKAIEAGVRLAGCTVHFVRAEMDHGPIILQVAVPVKDDDTEDSLAARILLAEHKIYPEAVRYIASHRVNILNERVFITGTTIPLRPYMAPIDLDND